MSSSSQLQFYFLPFTNSIRINQDKIQRSKLLLIPSSSSSSPETTLSKSHPIPIKQGRNGNLNLHDKFLVDEIRALPSKEIADVLRISDQGKTKLSDFNRPLTIANEPDLSLKEMVELPPDAWTFSIMIDVKEAIRVLDQAIGIGYRPDVATITLVINLLCKKGKVQRAFEVMDITGFEPTIKIYNCLLKGLCFVGRVEEADEMLMNIKKGSIKPDIYTYTAVMDGFCKVGRSNEALELLHEAIEIGLEPSVVTYNTLFNGYSKEGRPINGFGVLNQIKERNCRPDFISYSTVLNGLLK